MGTLFEYTHANVLRVVTNSQELGEHLIWLASLAFFAKFGMHPTDYEEENGGDIVMTVTLEGQAATVRFEKVE